ncbi:hypothetical protein BJX64DRAFT_67243 [Aspergillus heterothallicus]
MLVLNANPTGGLRTSCIFLLPLFLQIAPVKGEGLDNSQREGHRVSQIPFSRSSLPGLGFCLNLIPNQFSCSVSRSRLLSTTRHSRYLPHQNTSTHAATQRDIRKLCSPQSRVLSTVYTY